MSNKYQTLTLLEGDWATIREALEAMLEFTSRLDRDEYGAIQRVETTLANIKQAEVEANE